MNTTDTTGTGGTGISLCTPHHTTTPTHKQATLLDKDKEIPVPPVPPCADILEMAEKADKTVFCLTLTPAPGTWQQPPEQRLRAALKRLLRTHGLRCTRCTPAPGDALQANQGATKATP